MPNVTLPYLGWMVPFPPSFFAHPSEIPCETSHIAHLRVDSIMNALLNSISPQTVSIASTCAESSSKSNVYPKFATLSAPKLLQEVWHGNRPSTSKLHSVAKSTASLRKSWCEWRTAIKTPSLHQMSSEPTKHARTPVKSTIRPLDRNPTQEPSGSVYEHWHLPSKTPGRKLSEADPHAIHRRRFQVEDQQSVQVSTGVAGPSQWARPTASVAITSGWKRRETHRANS
jgi:hypothetical protein